jgi:hypothetical protein
MADRIPLAAAVAGRAGAHPDPSRPRATYPGQGLRLPDLILDAEDASVADDARLTGRHQASHKESLLARLVEPPKRHLTWPYSAIAHQVTPRRVPDLPTIGRCWPFRSGPARWQSPVRRRGDEPAVLLHRLSDANADLPHPMDNSGYPRVKGSSGPARRNYLNPTSVGSSPPRGTVTLMVEVSLAGRCLVGGRLTTGASRQLRVVTRAGYCPRHGLCCRSRHGGDPAVFAGGH